MATFVLAFGLLAVVMTGMAIGAILMGKTIKGSCGGLNAVAGADQCLVCKKPVDPDSPLRDRLQCPRAREMAKRMGTSQVMQNESLPG
ncbi:MAG: (Na+)-NQR maturation NqrM [Pseudomonadota bacterium]